MNTSNSNIKRTFTEWLQHIKTHKLIYQYSSIPEYNNKKIWVKRADMMRRIEA